MGPDLRQHVVVDDMRTVLRLRVHVEQDVVGAHRDGRLAPESENLELILQTIRQGALSEVDEQLTTGEIVQRGGREVDEAALVADGQSLAHQFGGGGVLPDGADALRHPEVVSIIDIRM